MHPSDWRCLWRSLAVIIVMCAIAGLGMSGLLVLFPSNQWVVRLGLVWSVACGTVSALLILREWDLP